MRSARVSVIAAVVLLAATAAEAADYPQYLPPQPMPQPICVPRVQAHLYPGVPICAEEVFSTWYLRGDIGITNQKVKRLENILLPANAQHPSMDFDSSSLFGLGFGANFNNWLRVDVTGEYRGRSDFHGLDIIGRGQDARTNEMRAKKEEWLFLLNAYADLGTWWCVTPFVGAGVGFAHVTMSGFTDTCTTCKGFDGDGNVIAAPGVAHADEASKWNFAWALHAGLAFQVSNSLALEFAYRYADLGDGITGDVVTFTGDNKFKNPVTFRDLTSHDFKLGVRFTCCDTPVAPAPVPVMYQPPPPPPPVYQAPPLYAPPPQPVMRKG